MAISSLRRVAKCLNPRSSCFEINHSLRTSPVGLCYNTSRFYSLCNVPHGGFSSHIFQEIKDILWKNKVYKCIDLSSASCRLSYRAQIAWRRLFEMYSYNGPILPPISRIACAVSFSLSRSNLVAPGILAFIVGEVAWNKRSLAHAENFPIKDSLYMHAQGGHGFATSFIFSLLEGLILVLRSIYLAILFSPCMVMAPFSDSFGVEFRRSWLHIVRLTLEKAGPAFIKWGQWAAARPDLFPRDLCHELAELHTKAPAHSFAYTKKAVEKAFGRKLAEIFDKFEEEPLASGSVAQVHQATLKFRYPRQQVKPMLVAVKVRHPGVGEAIRRDFVLINLFAKVSQFIPTLRWLRLDESIQQFAVFMMSQVDLAREAANLSRFIYNFRHWKDVSFPKPLYPLVHPAVLVETYEHGESILHYVDKLEGQEHIKTALAHIGTHALLKMLLVDNFIHADMHPGNILVRELQGKTSAKSLFKSRPHVVFLDVGMTAELSKKDRDNVLEFFKAVALRDGRCAAECTLRLSNKQNCPYPEAFIKEVDNTFKLWGSDDGDFLHPADCMQLMLEQVRRHKVNIDGNICTVIVTTMVLEGWQQKLDPGYDSLEALQALLFKVDLVDSLAYTIGGVMAP
ncbi:Protein kinase superfamily protein [Perilla frutescens var. hirtella]|uniref:Protein kinase superfamily protein n=1 Tax=Perilla frutescens var. hirtella TaxID=608512 RepID=A0AAD4JKM0_PERFH|nr:Protein kinase superfamily protein [Perilla frutescens var. hirtella]